MNRRPRSRSAKDAASRRSAAGCATHSPKCGIICSTGITGRRERRYDELRIRRRTSASVAVRARGGRRTAGAVGEVAHRAGAAMVGAASRAVLGVRRAAPEHAVGVRPRGDDAGAGTGTVSRAGAARTRRAGGRVVGPGALPERSRRPAPDALPPRCRYRARRAEPGGDLRVGRRIAAAAVGRRLAVGRARVPSRSRAFRIARVELVRAPRERSDAVPIHHARVHGGMNDPPRRTRGTLNHLWFWSFWHWSVESFRGGSLLHDPVHGLAGHWDEWFRHEASADERRGVARVGATERSQRAFVAWLARCWCREVELGGAHVPPAFALAQLADVPPFRDWPAFARHRSTYGAAGVSAIVLAEGSVGEPTDVRAVETIVLPADADGTASAFIAEGFHASEVDLEIARQAAMSVLAGPGLASLLARWLASGRRPYPRALTAVLGLGWLVVAGIIAWLLVGPDPGARLVPLGATLTALWGALVLVALTTGTVVVVRGWREGGRWRAHLEAGQIRLRMNGGLTLLGGSAGLPFSLDTLLATYRAESRAHAPTWLWRQAIGGLHAHATEWAATGVVTANVQIKPVLLEAKIRAGRQARGAEAMLVARQSN